MSPGGSTVLFRALPSKSQFTISEKRQLESFAQRLSQDVAEGRTFTCLLTSDRALRNLNSRFLRHDYATDVLSFPCGVTGGELGDLAISAERAEAQAQEFGHTRIDEIRILMLHGVLHLAGMDHENDKGEMARAERKWRDQLSLPNTLISRTRKARSA
jgi:probable rRNA maturation factor